MIKYFREPFIQSQIKTTDFKLYDFQVDAVDKLKIHFQHNNRGILHMPCGTGKTLIGCYLAKQYQFRTLTNNDYIRFVFSRATDILDTVDPFLRRVGVLEDHIAITNREMAQNLHKDFPNGIININIP